MRESSARHTATLSVCAPTQGDSKHAESDSTVGAAEDPTAGSGDIRRLSVTVSWGCSNKGPQTGCLEQHKCTSHSSGGGSQVGVLAGPTRSSRGILPGSPHAILPLCVSVFLRTPVILDWTCPNDFHLNSITSVNTLFPNKVTLRYWGLGPELVFCREIIQHRTIS